MDTLGMIDLALSPLLFMLWSRSTIEHISSVGIHRIHCGWQTFLEVTSICMPRVHILLRSHKDQCSEGLTCLWSQTFALLWWVILSDIWNLPIQTGGVFFSYHGNSFAWPVQLLDFSWLVCVHWKKCATFVNRSMMTLIESWCREVLGRPTIKSMMMSSHFHEGIDRGCKAPADFKWLAFILWHVSHSDTYWAISLFILVH
jgi:hypothetical protein